MTDVAYLCHNRGSVHEVESIRQNLILDLRTAASYELSGQHRLLNPGVRFLRWSMTRGLARVLWPGHSSHPRLAWDRRLGREPAAPSVLTFLISRGSLRRATRIEPVSALRCQ